MANLAVVGGGIGGWSASIKTEVSG